LRANTRHVGASGIQGSLSLVTACKRSTRGRIGNGELAATQVELLPRATARGIEIEGSVKLLAREREFAPTLCDRRLGTRHTGFGAPNFRLCTRKLRIELGRVHARNDCAGVDYLSLFDKNISDATSEFRGNENLLRLDPAVGQRDTSRLRAAAQLVPKLLHVIAECRCVTRRDLAAS
jgi:hypothetical protein